MLFQVIEVNKGECSSLHRSFANTQYDDGSLRLSELLAVTEHLLRVELDVLLRRFYRMNQYLLAYTFKRSLVAFVIE